MRNLHLRKRHRLDEQLVPQPLTACTWDNGADSVICAYGPTKENPLLALGRWVPQQNSTHNDSNAESQIELITSFDAPCPLPDLECDKVLSLYYLPEKSTICLVLAGGDLILIRESPTNGEEKIEIVGSVEVGITAAEWSPDGELLVLTTRADTVLFMTRELENSTTANLTEDDIKASKHVSVGWGKKETQFTGRGARALRDPTMPEKVDEGVRSSFDKDETTISWRGDGHFLAVNSRQASSRRVIRVYSREGNLDGVSEPVDNLEAALSWRPAGNLIAGIQRFSDRVDVVFFERNGLRHGEFTLRCPAKEHALAGSTSSIEAFSLKWNCDSTVLAVCFQGTIQLWTMGNYHWYLKQEIITGGRSDLKFPLLSWDPEQAMRLAFVEPDFAEINQYASTVTRSPTTVSQTGTVAVIDGSSVKLTALRFANVPPPMCQAEVTMKQSVADVSILQDGQTEFIAVTDIAGSSEVYEWNPRKVGVNPSSIFTRSTTGAGQGSRFRVKFQDRDTMLVIEYAQQKTSAWQVDIRSGDAQATPEWPDRTAQDVVWALGPDRSILCSISGEGRLTPIKSASEESVAPSMPTVEIPQDVDQTEFVKGMPATVESTQEPDAQSEQLTAFSMNRNGILYAGRKVLARDATSFAVTPAHLLYTTSKHMLKFVHLSSKDDLVIPPDTPEADERCRAVERGARIVTVIPKTAAVILQMPRGNLETIFPRALVLAEIRRNVDSKDYKKAFMNCRKQRVDMNIIHDHNPGQLLSHVELFVDQIVKAEHIDLFLSQLRDEDVTLTMYKDTLAIADAGQPGAAQIISQPTVGKVNRVCDAFLSVLRTRLASNIQNIITAHVCKTPPDIEAGLQEVARLQREGEAAGERAVEHICFLVDVNRLYDSSLGLYDLDLALLVAQQSQKDPREYLPFLQRLRDLPELRRKFDIDNHLSRHKKALADLWELDEFAEYKAYAAKHGLFDDALTACRYDETKYRELTALHADHLLKFSRYFDAGLAYEYIGARESAAEAYRLAHCWQESLANASLAGFDQAQTEELATILADSLIEAKDFHAAATIHKDYLLDIEGAARLFCRGNWFTDAIRLLSLAQKTSSIPDIVDAGLTESMGSSTELLAECKAQLNAQVPRLRELRIKKAEEPLAFFEGTGEGADIPDNVSLAATDASTMGGSLFTRYTGKTGTVATNATHRTAKNRRREERRRARGKKGSVYEEEYLINSIGRLIERVNSVGEETQRLVVGLMGRGMRERARAVDNAMRELVGLCSGCRDEVFQVAQQEEKNGPGGAAGGEMPGAPGEMGDDSGEIPPPKIDAPTVRAFEGLSLLRP